MSMHPFKLIEKPENQRETYLVRIIGIANDGVYVVKSTRYSKERFESKTITALQELLKTQYDVSEFQNWEINLPYADDPIEELESVEIEYTDETGKVWDVEVDYGQYDEDEDEDDE